MAFVKIWIHAVWSTKNRESILEKSKRIQLFKHIRQNAQEKEIYIDFINSVEDHIHALLCLNAVLSISKTMQLIKGKASFWQIKEISFVKNFIGLMNTLPFQ
jgi:REP element-mobilizing transposase RayT